MKHQRYRYVVTMPSTSNQLSGGRRRSQPTTTSSSVLQRCQRTKAFYPKKLPLKNLEMATVKHITHLHKMLHHIISYLIKTDTHKSLTSKCRRQGRAIGRRTLIQWKPLLKPALAITGMLLQHMPHIHSSPVLLR